MMRKPAAEQEEKVSIKIKKVTPRLPKDKKEELQLDEDLERIGCAQLRHRPWRLKGEYMIREIRAGASN